MQKLRRDQRLLLKTRELSARNVAWVKKEHSTPTQHPFNPEEILYSERGAAIGFSACRRFGIVNRIAASESDQRRLRVGQE